MARLTLLSKSLIGLAVIGGMASAVWNFGLKDKDLSAYKDLAALPGLLSAASDKNPSTPPAPSAASANSTASPSGNEGRSAAEIAEQGRKAMVEGDFSNARKQLELAVQRGDAGAACHLAEMTLKGQGGITVDREAAAKLFQLAQSRNAICFSPGQ
jgi:TPR repeat protein